MNWKVGNKHKQRKYWKILVSGTHLFTSTKCLFSTLYFFLQHSKRKEETEGGEAEGWIREQREETLKLTGCSQRQTE